MKRKVIIITDGDKVAKKTVEKVAEKIGGRCISLSGGNPTPFSGPEIVAMIKKATKDPVLVMLDDKGNKGEGRGERALAYLAQHQDIDLLGVVAVASNTEGISGTEVDFSISQTGQVVRGIVNKSGQIQSGTHLYGDTVDILNKLDIPIVIGTGDIGKMEGTDSLSKGSPVTLKAVEEILARSEWKRGRYR